MHSDVADLRDFYATPLGHVSRRLISRQIRAIWPKTPVDTLVGIGFAAPYLNVFRSEVRCIGAVMPTRQGALIWPSDAPRCSVLADEELLPFADNSVDRILLIHGLEMMERSQVCLREIWRILAPQGRILIVVPNRRGLWAQTDQTPFGYGRPYSRGQLERLLTDAMLMPEAWQSALFLPPLHRNALLKWATTWERVGLRATPGFAGVILVEASKQVIAPAGRAKSALRLKELLPSGGRILAPKPALPRSQRQTTVEVTEENSNRNPRVGLVGGNPRVGLAGGNPQKKMADPDKLEPHG